MSKIRITIFSLIVVVVIIVGVFGVGYWRFQKSVEAVAGFPYQIGLMTTVLSPCVPVPPLGVCVAAPDAAGTAFCNTKGPYTCAGYTYVSGVPAGGMGISVLLPIAVPAAIGLVPGASLIGGYMSPVLAETGVSASIGGSFPPGVASLPGKSFPGFAMLMKKAFEDVKFSIAGEKR